MAERGREGLIEINSGDLRAAVEAQTRLALAIAFCLVDPEAAVDVERRVVLACEAYGFATRHHVEIAVVRIVF